MLLDRYNALRDGIRTGDAIFFAGKGIESGLIKRITKSRFSHVGMALWITPVVIEEPRLFLIESTTLNTEPDITGEYRRGVQMLPLGQRLAGYDGQAWWGRLKDPVTDLEKIILLDWCWKQETSRIPYDTAQAIVAAIDPEKWIFPFGWLRKLMPWAYSINDLKAQFCAELYTEALRLLGRVDSTTIPSEQVPEDVYRFDCIMKPVISLCEDKICDM